MKRRKNKPKDVRPYDEDSLTNIWSSGKSIASILIAILEDRGLLKYSDKLSKFWPELKQNGLEKIETKDLMMHQAGLSNLK